MNDLRPLCRPRRAGAVLAAASVFVSALQGCGDGPAPGGASDGAAWTVGEPSVVLAQGPGADFFDVAGVVRLSDGRLVVADGGSSELRFFAPDGRHLASVGRRGEGPGEFALMESMGPAGGDSVWVYDYGAARITIVAPDGTPARTAVVAPPLSAGIMVGRRSDGSFVLAQSWGSGDPTGPRSEGLIREDAVVAAYDAGGRLLDTLASVPGREVFQRMEGARMTMRAVPFAHTASHVLLGDDLVLGDQVGYSLVVLPPGGAAQRRLEWSGPPLDLGEDEVARWREGQVAAAPADRQASVRAYLVETPRPASRPAYGRLLADPLGLLWVAEYAHPSEEARTWNVLDPSGRWRGSAEMPPGFRPFQVGVDWILGVARDELDVERVELRPLRRGRALPD